MLDYFGFFEEGVDNLLIVFERFYLWVVCGGNWDDDLE